MGWGRQQQRHTVGSSNQQFWLWFQCPDDCAIPLPTLLTVRVWNYWSTIERLQQIPDHCPSGWLHYSCGCCAELASKIRITINCAFVWIPTWSLGEKHSCHQWHRRWKPCFLCQSPLSWHVHANTPPQGPLSPCKPWHDMKGLVFSSTFGLGTAPQFPIISWEKLKHQKYKITFQT